MRKPFNVGIVVGRFQPLHIGHEYLIDKLIELCDIPIVIIGSSDKSNSQRNPFDFETRKLMLENVYSNKIKVIGIPDRVNWKNDNSWGEYLLYNIKNTLNLVPNLIVSGLDTERLEWFGKDCKISFLFLSREDIQVSATLSRELLLNDNKDKWKEITNEKNHYLYEELKTKLKEIGEKENE